MAAREACWINAGATSDRHCCHQQYLADTKNPYAYPGPRDGCLVRAAVLPRAVGRVHHGGGLSRAAVLVGSFSGGGSQGA